jgi:hypothetical protein
LSFCRESLSAEASNVLLNNGADLLFEVGGLRKRLAFEGDSKAEAYHLALANLFEHLGLAGLEVIKEGLFPLCDGKSISNPGS